jgi:hypothetical protein
VRIATAAISAVMLTLGVAGPAMAHPTTAILPPLTVDLTHFASDNVAFEARFHEHFGSAGGQMTSNDWEDGAEFFVVTDPRGLYTYDVSDPKSPVQLGMVLLPQSQSTTNVALGQEDPSTDGKLVLMDGMDVATNERGMQIVNIEDPTNPVIVGSYGGSDHTWTCVSDVATGNGCAYAYGRSNNIIDIREPATPTKIGTGWKSATGEGGYAHDLTEIRPGLVMHAGAEPVLMDTTDPENPVLLSHVTLFDHASPNDDLYPMQRKWSTFGYHSVEWANQGTDNFLVMGTEIAPGSAGDDCSADESVIETWDATPIIAAFEQMETLKADGSTHEEARTAVFDDGTKVKFVRIDSYQAEGTGSAVTGEAPSNALYCAHWMEPNPSWDNGGVLAVGYYNRGARFVNVNSDGMMTEAGWFTGADAYAGSAQWADDNTVYVMDYVRGMDVISFTGEEATGSYSGVGSVSENAMTVAEMGALGIAPAVPSSGNSTALVMVGMALAAAAVARRRTATAVKA